MNSTRKALYYNLISRTLLTRTSTSRRTRVPLEDNLSWSAPYKTLLVRLATRSSPSSPSSRVSRRVSDSDESLSSVWNTNELYSANLLNHAKRVAKSVICLVRRMRQVLLSVSVTSARRRQELTCSNWAENSTALLIVNILCSVNRLSCPNQRHSTI